MLPPVLQWMTWPNHKRDPKWSDMEFQHRAWYSFVWLCGDQIVEQHLHNIDVCNWFMGTHPVRALALVMWTPGKRDGYAVWDAAEDQPKHTPEAIADTVRGTNAGPNRETKRRPVETVTRTEPRFSDAAIKILREMTRVSSGYQHEALDLLRELARHSTQTGRG